MRSLESRPELVEQKVEYEPELELCLRVLTTEIVGKEVDKITDRYLIQQINASKRGVASQGLLFKCQVAGCNAKCVLKKTRRGVLKLVAQSGECLQETEN